MDPNPNEPRRPRADLPSADWTIDDSRELYRVGQWGAGFFDIDANGDVIVQAEDGRSVVLPKLVADLEQRGLRLPLLVRLSDVLASRVRGIGESFRRAIEEYDYRGQYRGVYPIKVNQQRHVVEEIVEHGVNFGVGLEAGSKPELLVAVALLDSPDALIICNGYKDRSYIETALLAQRLGRRPVIVIDRYRELELLIKTAKELGIRPTVGLRARLSARGAGKWLESTGSRSKFGLSPTELVAAVDRLRSENMLDCLELLHAHIGSQITQIRAHKEALREVSRIFAGLVELGAPLRWIDVGGGLGVDYDGSQTDFHSSMNYSVQEYANDVVASVQEVCDEAGIPHPDIVSESGRAMVAHHSVLIFDVLGVHEMTPSQIEEPDETDHRVLHDLVEVWRSIEPRRVREAYHDATALRDEATSLFALGYLDLQARARAERLFFACSHRVLDELRRLDQVPEDLKGLEKELADTYYGNFSVFQSAPDHWAVKQLFPVMPIQRLAEEPTRRGVFADLTCDSDGKIDRFIHPTEDSKPVLELHRWEGGSYYVGVFLVGAYQEILGDLHNLFGDTDAVHVRIAADGRATVEHEVPGDQISDVLRYVAYDRDALLEKVRRTTEAAMDAGRMEPSESRLLRRRFEEGLRDYTYLSRDE